MAITQGQDGTHSWWWKDGTRTVPWPRSGKPPFNPYTLWKGTGWITRIGVQDVTKGPHKPNMNTLLPALDLQSSPAYAKAYDSLMRKYGKTGPKAELGMTLIGANQSYNMIIHRLTTLYRSFRAFNRGDFVTAFQVLRIRKDQKTYSTKKRVTRRDAIRLANEPADLYLETIFGWQPLLQDIYNTIGVLCRDIEPHRIMGGGRTSVNDSQSWNPSPGTTQSYETVIESWVRLKATIQVSNPNLDLANRLGLVNPAVVLWDAVPGSFLVNQFVNLQKWFERWTGQLGLSMTDIHLTGGVRRNAHNTYVGPGDYREWAHTDETFVRLKLSSLGVPHTLDFQLPTAHLQSRAVTLAALSSQSLTRRA